MLMIEYVSLVSLLCRHRERLEAQWCLRDLDWLRNASLLFTLSTEARLSGPFTLYFVSLLEFCCLRIHMAISLRLQLEWYVVCLHHYRFGLKNHGLYLSFAWKCLKGCATSAGAPLYWIESQAISCYQALDLFLAELLQTQELTIVIHHREWNSYFCWKSTAQEKSIAAWVVAWTRSDFE